MHIAIDVGREARLGADPADVRCSGARAERVALATFVVLVPYAIARSFFAARTRPLWFDEIITLLLARLPNLSTLGGALAHAADGHPPLFYLIEKLFASLNASEQVAFRMPSILGFAVTLVCVFIFIRRRDGNEVAAICAGGLLITVLYGRYAIEARPYSLMVACFAFALVCYQRAPKIGWMALMGCALAVSEALHYYAVFGLLPFIVAEAAFYLQARRFRWGVWVALAAGLAPLVAFWPLLSAMRSIQGAHYWGPPYFAVALGIFVTVWDTHWILGVMIAAILVQQYGVFFPDLCARVLQSVKARQVVLSEPGIQERLLGLGFLALPLVVFVAAILLHGGLADRYMILSALGFPLAGAFCLSRIDRKLVRYVSFFVLFAVVMHELYFWVNRKEPIPGAIERGEFRLPYASIKGLVDSAGYSDLPVVVSDGFSYLPIAHYASPETAKRFVFLMDCPQSVLYLGSDTLCVELAVLSRYVPLETRDYNAFRWRHPRFLLYSDGTDYLDWWLLRFKNEGHLVRVLAKDGPRRIYLVDLDQLPLRSK